jgi:uncharacterized protein (DUF779 family)
MIAECLVERSQTSLICNNAKIRQGLAGHTKSSGCGNLITDMFWPTSKYTLGDAHMTLGGFAVLKEHFSTRLFLGAAG